MIEIMSQILAVGHEAPYLISALAIACGLVFYNMTESRRLTLLFMPIAAFGAMLGIFVSREADVYFSTDQSSNIVAGGVLGVFVGVVFVVIAARIGHLLTNVIRARQAKKLRK